MTDTVKSLRGVRRQRKQRRVETHFDINGYTTTMAGVVTTKQTVIRKVKLRENIRRKPCFRNTYNIRRVKKNSSRERNKICN